MGLAFLAVFPNLLWQVHNNFPVIHHLQELSETQLVNVNRWDFLLTQLLFFPGTFLVFFFGLYALIRYVPFANYRLFFWSFFLSLGLFLLLKAKVYYTLGIYPIYFAFGSVYISVLLQNKAGKIIKPVLIVLVVLLFLPLYRLAFPTKSPQHIATHPELYRKLGLLTWEDGKEHQLPQDFADMLGWKELAAKVDSVYKRIPNPQKTLVLCDNYGQAGAINYFTKQGIEAVSFSADYVNWFDLDTEYVNVIRIVNSEDVEREWEEISPFFGKSVMADSITNPYAREKGTTIISFINARGNVNEKIERELEEEKSFTNKKTSP